MPDTFIKDVLRGVDVPVVSSTTSGTHPVSDTEVLHNRVLRSTAMANLRGREELIYDDEFFPIPHRLVRKLPPYFTPRGVHDGFRQLVVLDHVLYGEVFHADDIIPFNESCSHLMDNVFPLISNFLMKPSDPNFCLLPVLAPLCFSGELPLETCQLLLVLGVGTRVIEPLSIRSDCKVLESKVDADYGIRCRYRFNVYVVYVLTADGNEVLATLGLLYGGREDFPLDLFADAAIYVPDFRETDTASYNGDRAFVIGRLEGQCIPLLRFEMRIPDPAPGLETIEEVFVSGVKVSERSLQRGEIHLFEPRKLFLESSEFSAALFVRESFPGFFVGSFPPIQEVVEHIPTATKGLSHQYFLLLCRVDSKLVAILHICVHLLEIDIYIIPHLHFYGNVNM